MKKSQIVLLVLFLAISGLIFFTLSANKKTSVKNIKEEVKTVYLPVKKVNNFHHTLSLTSHGQVNPYASIVISSEVQGMLLKGNIEMKEGISFRKGDVLYRIDNQESFYTFAARRSGLVNMILNIIPDIELDFPAEKEKWMDFMNEMNKATRLPDLPKIKSDKERMFVTSRSIIAEYYSIKSLESRLDKYVTIAPFNGTVTDVFMEPGTIANPGAQIARIAKTGEFEVKVPIAIDDIDFFQDKSVATFTNSSDEVVGSGKIKRVSNVVNQQTQSIDVYYSIKPNDEMLVYNGMHLNVNIDKEVTKNTCLLPRTAVSNNKVAILDNDKVILRNILVIGSKPDSVYVTGLTDGEMAVLEQFDPNQKGISFKGVER